MGKKCDAINALIVKHGGTAGQGTVKDLLIVLAKKVDGVTVSGNTIAEVVNDWADKFTPAPASAAETTPAGGSD